MKMKIGLKRREKKEEISQDTNNQKDICFHNAPANNQTQRIRLSK